MKDLQTSCRMAVVQMEPVLFDKKASLEKVLANIREAAGKADFIVFPELTIPGYPYGMTFGYTVGHREAAGREDWKRYYDNSLLADGEESKALGQAAKEAGCYLSIGVSERDPLSATLYNANFLYGPDGTLLSVHRKLKPTGAERLVWGEAQKNFFPVVDTPWGPVGSMICWESYMPLARVALYQKGITIYLAPNTNDNPEWQDSVRHIAIEGHCYFINADLFFRRDSYPKDLNGIDEVNRLPEIACRGGSSIVDPFGHEVCGPVWDQETILYADLDMQKVPASRMEFDACGHYSRPDVLDLRVYEEPED